MTQLYHSVKVTIIALKHLEIYTPQLYSSGEYIFAELLLAGKVLKGLLR